MNRVCIGHFSRAQNARDVAIALIARGRANTHVFISHPDVQGIAVGLRVNGDRLQAQLFAGADNPQRDFAAVRNENFFEQGYDLENGGLLTVCENRNKW